MILDTRVSPKYPSVCPKGSPCCHCTEDSPSTKLRTRFPTLHKSLSLHARMVVPHCKYSWFISREARANLKKLRGKERSLPVLAFHGTEEANIVPICKTGFRVPGTAFFLLHTAFSPPSQFLFLSSPVCNGSFVRSCQNPCGMSAAFCRRVRLCTQN